MNKTFSSGRDCQMRLTFENGNTASTIWGFGSYSDNHLPELDDWDLTKGSEFSKVGLFHNPKQSKTAEVMYECDEETQEAIDGAFPDESNPIGYMKFDEWYKLISILSGKGIK